MLMAIGLEVAILPGFAVARRMDLEGDWKRHLMLSPAIGLLICLGLSGISFILEWTLEALTYLIISVNILAMLAIRTEVESEQTLAKIERSPWFWIFTVIACFIALTPLTYSRPMGVDWIGFASRHYLAVSFNLSERCKTGSSGSDATTAPLATRDHWMLS